MVLIKLVIELILQNKLENLTFHLKNLMIVYLF